MAYTQATVQPVIAYDEVAAFPPIWDSVQGQPEIVAWCLETIWNYNAIAIMAWLARRIDPNVVNELLSRHTLQIPDHLLLFHIIADNVKIADQLKDVIKQNTNTTDPHETRRIIAHELVYLNDDIFAESLGQDPALWE